MLLCRCTTRGKEFGATKTIEWAPAKNDGRATFPPTKILAIHKLRRPSNVSDLSWKSKIDNNKIDSSVQ